MTVLPCGKLDTLKKMSRRVGEEDFDDSLFEGLSKEELEELDGFLDPDNELLPARDRMPPQTTKRATGPYHREHLIKYMKEKALSIEDRDDPVPYIKKTRGKVFKSREEQQKEKDYLVTPKVEVSTSDSLQSKQSSKVNSAFAKELEDLFDGVDEEDLAELADELGLEESQFGQFISSKSSLPVQGVGESSSSRRVTSPQLYTYHSSNPVAKSQVDEPVSVVDVDAAVKQMRENDPALRHLNLNNQQELSIDQVERICEALKDNNKLKSLEMANTKSGDSIAELLAEALKLNLGLRVLNLESNRITAKGIKMILRALEDNPMLEELKLANQQSVLGAGVEMEIAKIIEHNTTLRKFGLSFSSNGPRVLVDKYVMRNNDIARKKRLIASAEDEDDYEEENLV